MLHDARPQSTQRSAKRSSPGSQPATSQRPGYHSLLRPLQERFRSCHRRRHRPTRRPQHLCRVQRPPLRRREPPGRPSRIWSRAHLSSGPSSRHAAGFLLHPQPDHRWLASSRLPRLPSLPRSNAAIPGPPSRSWPRLGTVLERQFALVLSQRILGPVWVCRRRRSWPRAKGPGPPSYEHDGTPQHEPV